MSSLILRGVVTKVGYMNKTATVSVSSWIMHPRTMKRIERSKKYLTHDPENKLRMDDMVLIQNCPPVSARKRFVVHTVLKRSETSRDAGRVREAQATRAKS